MKPSFGILTKGFVSNLFFIFFQLLNIKLCKCNLTNWTLGDITFPQYAWERMVSGGYDSSNNKIWLILNQKAIEYNPTTNKFLSHSISSGATLNTAFTKLYTIAYNNNIYFASDRTIYKFDMLSIKYQPLKTLTTYRPCVTITNDGKYLIMLGGFYSTPYFTGVNYFKYYDITKGIIYTAKHSMQYVRQSFTCNVASNGHLYAIGGYGNDLDVPYDNIEKINVNDMSNINNCPWTLISSKMSKQRWGVTSVVYSKYIYILGGSHSNSYLNLVEQLNTDNDIIKLVPSMIKPRPAMVSAMIVNHKIYAFGGDQFYQNYEYSNNLNKSFVTIITTMNPTTTFHPSTNPTISTTTFYPSTNPTYYPSTNPTISTTTTTYYPSTNPTFYPLLNVTSINTLQSTQYTTITTQQKNLIHTITANDNKYNMLFIVIIIISICLVFIFIIVAMYCYYRYRIKKYELELKYINVVTIGNGSNKKQMNEINDKAMNTNMFKTDLL